MRIIGETHVGLRRPNNQDSFSVNDIGYAAVGIVCDGMGGANGGDIASSMAVDIITSAVLRDLKEGYGETSVAAVLASAVSVANTLVHERAQEETELHGMGSTVIAAVVKEDLLVLAHAGDSRVYIYRDGELHQVTTDHTMAQELVNIGEITAEMAETHNTRHVLTRSLGTTKELRLDTVSHTLMPGDIVLLCSDGLYNFVDSGTMTELVVKCHNEQTTTPLVEKALEGGGGDNVTVVLISQGEAVE